MKDLHHLLNVPEYWIGITDLRQEGVYRWAYDGKEVVVLSYIIYIIYIYIYIYIHIYIYIYIYRSNSEANTQY